MRKQRTKEPTLREKLSQGLLKDLQASWEAHGATVIEEMRTKDPTRYAELCAKLIMSAEVRPDGFESCENQEEIAIKLLEGVGTPRDCITPDMVVAAVQAHDDLVARLGKIAQGH